MLGEVVDVPGTIEEHQVFLKHAFFTLSGLNLSPDSIVTNWWFDNNTFQDRILL